MHEPLPARHVRFGPFELDIRSGELKKGPSRLKVPDQSIEVLKTLLEQPGELVTREQLRERLWPSDTFVDFEHGLNAAVRRLREVSATRRKHRNSSRRCHGADIASSGWSRARPRLFRPLPCCQPKTSRPSQGRRGRARFVRGIS